MNGRFADVNGEGYPCVSPGCNGTGLGGGTGGTGGNAGPGSCSCDVPPEECSSSSLNPSSYSGSLVKYGNGYTDSFSGYCARFGEDRAIQECAKDCDKNDYWGPESIESKIVIHKDLGNGKVVDINASFYYAILYADFSGINKPYTISSNMKECFVIEVSSFWKTFSVTTVAHEGRTVVIEGEYCMEGNQSKTVDVHVTVDLPNVFYYRCTKSQNGPGSSDDYCQELEWGYST